MSKIALQAYISCFDTSSLAGYADADPWSLTQRSESVVRSLLQSLPDGYAVAEEIAIHETAVVEHGAILKGPLILGPKCFVASGAYLRGGNWIDQGCTFGPGAELKSSFVFSGSKLAHFNFVGDSILGRDVNLEAGSIVANYRNEREDKEILVRMDQQLIRTGVLKFGALIGDGSRIGANAVVAPGAVLAPRFVLPRTQLIDQEREDGQ